MPDDDVPSFFSRLDNNVLSGLDIHFLYKVVYLFYQILFIFDVQYVKLVTVTCRFSSLFIGVVNNGTSVYVIVTNFR